MDLIKTDVSHRINDTTNSDSCNGCWFNQGKTCSRPDEELYPCVDGNKMSIWVKDDGKLKVKKVANASILHQVHDIK